jgi:hypothetical protein
MRGRTQRKALGASAVVLLALIAAIWLMNPGQIVAQTASMLLGVALIVFLLTRSSTPQEH